MSFLSEIFNAIGAGRLSLKDATTLAPNKMGVYMLFYHGLKYVGKAECGLRKRFVQYYNGTAADYSTAKTIHEHRDEITVMWMECATRGQCIAMERKLIRNKCPEWNKQSGWGDKGVFAQDNITKELMLDELLGDIMDDELRRR